jgi:CrcB protein
MVVVAVGGSIGATGRWAIRSTYDVVPGDWPWPTLVVNIIGCLLIGVASRRLERGSLRWNAIITGLLGGFTTMSSFAVELNDMVDLDRTGSAVAYGAVTLGAGAAAVTLGLATSPGATTSPEQRPS